MKLGAQKAVGRPGQARPGEARRASLSVCPRQLGLRTANSGWGRDLAQSVIICDTQLASYWFGRLAGAISGSHQNDRDSALGPKMGAFYRGKQATRAVEESRFLELCFVLPSILLSLSRTRFDWRRCWCCCCCCCCYCCSIYRLTLAAIVTARTAGARLGPVDNGPYRLASASWRRDKLDG